MPTVRGIAVAALATGCFLAGWVLGYPELAILGVAGALALAAAWLHLARPAPLRAYRDIAPPQVPRGDRALAVLTCTHTGRRGLGLMRAADRCGTQRVAIQLPPLRPGGSYTTTYQLPTRRRGHIPVGPLELTATDPLGLVRRVRTCGGELTLSVQPRVVPLAALPSGRVASPEGPRSDRATGGTVTFHALRPYVFGDDLRHIHWRTSARTNTLMVRQLVDTSLPRTIVLLDTRSCAYPSEDDFELAVDVTASVALAAAGSGFPVSVLGGQEHLSALDGRSGQRAALLDRLALIGTVPAAEDRPADSLSRALAAARPGQGGGALTVVTGAGGTADLALVAAAQRGYDRAVVVRVGVELPLPASVAPLVVVDAPDLATFATAWRRAAG
jgi:uncharacterized protein (DUF58 family)